MGDLSKNFSRSEFECHCGCGFSAVDMRLVEALQQLRELLGVPVKVNCGCRCEEHNSAVGGSKNSQHLTGKAADITCKEFASREVARIAEGISAFDNGGIGIYQSKNFTHLDVRNDGPARWGG